MAVLLLFSCSKDDETVRLPENILGVWAPSDSVYLEFGEKQVVHRLDIFHQDGESIGRWELEVYYYEPGYNLVIYMDYTNVATVYEIVTLSDKELTWCPVKTITQQQIEQTGIGKLIGEVINEAQTGFTLNPELYQTLSKVSEDKFFSLLESLDIMYPW